MSLLNKLLVNSGSLVVRKATPLRVGEGGRTYKHVVAVPPRNPLSFGEKIMFFSLLGVGMWFFPVWVLYHLPDYQKEDRYAYTGKL